MPKYDYKCKSCDAKFELKLTISEKEADSSKKTCPECSSRDVLQVLSFAGTFTRSSSRECPSSRGKGCGNSGFG